MVSTNVRKQRTRRALGLLLLFGLIAVLIVASIAIGTRSMSLGTLLHPDQITAAIIRDLRIPRTMLGVLVGAALGVSGTLIQGHTRNPLADPGVPGISSGAACAVVVGFTFFGITSIVGTVVVAFTGAILATLLVFSLTSIGSGRMNPLSVLLGGAALSAVLSSMTSALVLTNEDNLDRMRFWNAGSIAGRDLTISIGIAPFVVLGLVAAFATARQLNLLNLGDDVASSLGVNTNRARLIGMLLIALLAGAATAGAGPIGFVGLVVPHVVRVFTGPDYRWLLPYSALAGVALLLLADVAGRIIARPGELQVGIVLAFVGAPFVLYLLSRRKLVAL